MTWLLVTRRPFGPVIALLGLFPGFHIAQLSFQVIVNCGVNFLMQCDNPQKAKVFTFTDEVRFRIKFRTLVSLEPARQLFVGGVNNKAVSWRGRFARKSCATGE